MKKHSADIDSPYYETECGVEFVFIDGTQTDNIYRYCPSCGRRLKDLSTRFDKVKDNALRFG